MHTKLISCCGKRHVQVFSEGAKRIKENILADEYEVYLPTDITELIKASEWNIVDEFSIGNIGIATHKNIWVKQQLLKIYGVHKAAIEGFKNIIIWDGDTIPLQKITFFEENKVNYFKSGEYHLPYFETINKLLGMNKEVNFSFIAQCFALKAEWIKDFINAMDMC